MSDEGLSRRELIGRGAVACVATTGAAGVASASEAGAAQQVQRDRQDGMDGFGVVIVAGAAAVGGLVGGLLASAIANNSGTDAAPSSEPAPRGGQRRGAATRPARRGEGGESQQAPICPACGADVDSASNYCAECGEPI